MSDSKPWWQCAYCEFGCTSEDTLMSHASVNHPEKLRRPDSINAQSDSKPAVEASTPAPEVHEVKLTLPLIAESLRKLSKSEHLCSTLKREDIAFYLAAYADHIEALASSPTVSGARPDFTSVTRCNVCGECFIGNWTQRHTDPCAKCGNIAWHTVAKRGTLEDLVKYMMMELSTYASSLEAPNTFPFTCDLCGKSVESLDDRMMWHGLGNCVDICTRCNGSGEEPKAAAPRQETAPRGSGTVSPLQQNKSAPSVASRSADKSVEYSPSTTPCDLCFGNNLSSKPCPKCGAEPKRMSREEAEKFVVERVFVEIRRPAEHSRILGDDLRVGAIAKATSARLYQLLISVLTGEVER